MEGGGWSCHALAPLLGRLGESLRAGSYAALNWSHEIHEIHETKKSDEPQHFVHLRSSGPSAVYLRFSCVSCLSWFQLNDKGCRQSMRQSAANASVRLGD